MKNSFKLIGIITLVMMIGFPMAVFADTLSGSTYVYRIQDQELAITFTGNNFTMSLPGEHLVTGNYSVSGNRVSLTSATNRNWTQTMTIVNANTLRDWDGDNWIRQTAPAAGIVIVENKSPYRQDTSVYMDISNADNIRETLVAANTVSIGSHVTFENVPAGRSWRVLVIDGNQDAYQSAPFTLRAGDTRRFVYDGRTITAR